MEQREDAESLVNYETSHMVAGLCGVDLGLSGSGAAHRRRACELFSEWLARR